VTDQGNTPAHIGISLSGGGHRATLFSMGALLAVVDAGLNGSVRWISSVSGGSLANAVVATHCDFANVSHEEFGDLCRRVITRLSRHGSLSGDRLGVVVVSLYLSLLVVSAAAALTALVTGRWLLGVGTFLLLAIFASFRGKVIERGIARIWADDADAGVTLEAINRSVEHVFSTTDIRTGTPVFLSTSYVAAHGWAHPIRGTPLRLAVRASAAYPLLLPPVRWPLSRSTPSRFTNLADDLAVLADGGVYNNLGTEWQASLRQINHNTDGAVLRPELQTPVDLHLVVDCGKEPRRSALLWHSIPAIGDVYSFVRTYATTYGSTIQGRREFLKDTDDSVLFVGSTTRPGWGLPYATDALRLDGDRWRLAAWTTRTMGTHLNRVPRSDAVMVLAHGYAVALSRLSWNDKVPQDEADRSWREWLHDAVEEAQPNDLDAFAALLHRRRKKLPPPLWEPRTRLGPLRRPLKPRRSRAGGQPRSHGPGVDGSDSAPSSIGSDGD
jgi:predicted acylesterase/phospholipase RssA